MNFEKKHCRCGWCKKKLTKNRKFVDVPIGPECENHLPETLRVGITNHTIHDWNHTQMERGEFEAQRIVDKAFGEDIDILIMVNQMYYHNLLCCDVEIYYQVENEMVMIHCIKGDEFGGDGESIDTTYDDGEVELFYTEKQLLWKRRVALMLHPDSSTKLEVTHIDAGWIFYINGGYYDGPIPAGTNATEHAEQNGWNHVPIPMCGYCDGFRHIAEDHDKEQATIERIQSWLDTKPTCYLCNCIYHAMIEKCTNRRLKLEAAIGDITQDENYFEGPFLGELGHWVRKEHRDDNWIADPHWESEEGQKIIIERILPFWFRGMDMGFDEEWKWITGEAVYNPEQNEYLETVNDFHSITNG